MSKVLIITALALAAGLAVQTVRVAHLQTALAKAETAQAKAGQTQAQQAQQATETKAASLLDHAGNTQTNVYEYTQTIQQLEAGRAADAGRIAGLQHSLRTTATAHAQAASDLAACRDLGHRHQQLADLAAAGAGLVGAGIDLVKQRDAEVTLLKSQLLTERQLVQQISGQ